MGSLFVNFETKVIILTSSLILISVSLSSIASVLAQSDNTSGQEGDGNKASQSDENSQESNHNSMCVSGESVSLSCNNLSAKNIDAIVHHNDDEGEESGSGTQVYQKAITINPGERNWNPPSDFEDYLISLQDFVNLRPGDAGSVRSDVSFQVTWVTPSTGPGEARSGSCEVVNMDSPWIRLLKCENSFYHPEKTSRLTIVATSPNPLN
jgi:hypothetical protein